jgi:hypothetical protein
MSKRMIGIVSDLSKVVNHYISRIVPDFIMTEDGGHILYTWKHKLHGKKKGVPTLTLKHTLRGKV